ncbi:hypothetical protein ACEQPO_20770 [Bacillus sp. SL00103]
MKPSLLIPDIMRDVKMNLHSLLLLYNVSGEYAMVKAVPLKNGWISEKELVLEMLTSMKTCKEQNSSLRIMQKMQQNGSPE